ncbi:MAG: hypothetical protein KIT56_05360 [Gammaproteobacteria bacterium]|nr:hypothetical protein [Gammaproteobacteria bacterium]MCW5583302.1 hypothetical protein [Gammaproteobacteria bacterium]
MDTRARTGKCYQPDQTKLEALHQTLIDEMTEKLELLHLPFLAAFSDGSFDAMVYMVKCGEHPSKQPYEAIWRNFKKIFDKIGQGTDIQQLQADLKSLHNIGVEEREKLTPRKQAIFPVLIDAFHMLALQKHLLSQTIQARVQATGVTTTLQHQIEALQKPITEAQGKLSQLEQDLQDEEKLRSSVKQVIEKQQQGVVQGVQKNYDNLSKQVTNLTNLDQHLSILRIEIERYQADYNRFELRLKKGENNDESQAPHALELDALQKRYAALNKDISEFQSSLEKDKQVLLQKIQAQCQNIQKWEALPTSSDGDETNSAVPMLPELTRQLKILQKLSHQCSQYSVQVDSRKEIDDIDKQAKALRQQDIEQYGKLLTEAEKKGEELKRECEKQGWNSAWTSAANAVVSCFQTTMPNQKRFLAHDEGLLAQEFRSYAQSVEKDVQQHKKNFTTLDKQVRGITERLDGLKKKWMDSFKKIKEEQNAIFLETIKKDSLKKLTELEKRLSQFNPKSNPLPMVVNLSDPSALKEIIIEKREKSKQEQAEKEQRVQQEQKQQEQRKEPQDSPKLARRFDGDDDDLPGDNNRQNTRLTIVPSTKKKAKKKPGFWSRYIGAIRNCIVAGATSGLLAGAGLGVAMGVVGAIPTGGFSLLATPVAVGILGGIGAVGGAIMGAVIGVTGCAIHHCTCGEEQKAKRKQTSSSQEKRNPSGNIARKPPRPGNPDLGLNSKQEIGDDNYDYSDSEGKRTDYPPNSDGATNVSSTKNDSDSSTSESSVSSETVIEGRIANPSPKVTGSYPNLFSSSSVTTTTTTTTTHISKITKLREFEKALVLVIWEANMNYLAVRPSLLLLENNLSLIRKNLSLSCDGDENYAKNKIKQLEENEVKERRTGGASPTLWDERNRVIGEKVKKLLELHSIDHDDCVDHYEYLQDVIQKYVPVPVKASVYNFG